jgi:hypothetical protein
MSDRIPSSEIVRRGIRQRDLYWDQQRQQIGIHGNAFVLSRKGEGELSVFRAALEEPARTFERLSLSRVLAELSVERVCDLGLEVVDRAEPDNPAHAAILGLPTPDFDDPHAVETDLAQVKGEELTRLVSDLRYRPEPIEALVEELIRKGKVVG